MITLEKPTIAILVPTYDELGKTIDRSIRNLLLRIQEIQQVWSGASIAFLIGVNGTKKLEEVAKVQTLIESHRRLINENVHVAVHHYTQAGKENAMNQLAKEAATYFARSGRKAEYHIGTDVKVYRAPGSLVTLIKEFSQARQTSELPRYLGGSVLPYPIDVYEQHYELSQEQRLFYTLLEIDKDPDILEILPKSHVRGGLYITGEWLDLYTDIPDDYQLHRRSEQNFGPGSTQISKKAVGYVIPRLSFADYFAVRLNRSIPAEENLRQTHPELNPVKESPIESENKKVQLEQLKKLHPEKAALFITKKKLDALCRELALQMDQANMKLSELTQEVHLNLSGELSKHAAALTNQSGISIETVQELANYNPELAAKYIVVYYRAIVKALVVDKSSVKYGPREEQFRGMLPLDE